MSSAWWAYGSELKIGDDDGTSEAFTKIAEIRDITGPSMSKDAIEVTNQDSSNGWREYIPGLKDAGEVSVSANWIPIDETQDGTDGLLSKFTDDDMHNFQIIVPSDGTATTTIAISAVVTSFSPTLPLDAQGQLDFTLKISGKPTFS
jgi:predicted secreted protein